MPNTLAHIAVQTVLLRTGGVFPGLFSAALLSCIIPDVPWILQRLASVASGSIDPYQLRAYSTVQATLLFSVLLSGAAAMIFTRPWLAWAALSTGSLVHLLLDATELKWANGVHLFAPWDWTHINWGFVWPEHWLVRTVSVGGLAAFVYFAIGSRPPSAGLRINSLRARGIVAVLVIYFVAPFWLLQEPIRANNHYLATLSEEESRTGRTLELDRVSVFKQQNDWFAKTYAGELLKLEGKTPLAPGNYSLKGVFPAENRLLVEDLHRHDGRRDLASVIGLSLILGWFAVAFYGYWRRCRQS